MKTLDYFRLLYGEEAPGSLVLLSREPGKERDYLRPHWFAADRLERAAGFVERVGPQTDIYHGVSLQDWARAAEEKRRRGLQARPGNTRGFNITALAVPGIHADIDIADALAHKASDLPPTIDAGLALIARFPLRPTLIVRSGYGLYPWWLLREAYLIDTEIERQRLALAVLGVQAWLRHEARALGWALDATADLARVIRPVGSFNHKRGARRAVDALEQTGPRYNLNDFEPFALEPEPDREAYTGPERLARLAPVVTGCRWMQHCRDHAAALTEPIWYALLSVLAKCEGGAETAQEWSRPHSGYDKAATAAKLNHAAEFGPVRCERVREQLDGAIHCNACPAVGLAKSPVSIGHRGPAQAAVAKAALAARMEAING